MRIKSARDFWSGLMFVVIGIAFAIGATSYGMGPPCSPQDACHANLWARFQQLSAHPGAGYLPLGLAVLLAGLGTAILFKSLTIESERRRPDRADRLASARGDRSPRSSSSRPCSSRSASSLTIPVLVIVVSLAGDGLRWKEILANAVILAVGSSIDLRLAGWSSRCRSGPGSSAEPQGPRHDPPPHGSDQQPLARLQRRLHAPRTCSTPSSACCSAR